MKAKAIVYRGMLRETAVPVLLEMITPEIAKIDCIECGGSGRWDFGPTPETCGPCVDCKGTGKIFVSA